MNKPFRLALYFFLGTLFLAQPAYAALTLTSYWNLDETSGTRVDSVSGNNLSSVNNTAAVPGYDGNAASFPIASSTYLTVADNASLSTTGSTTFRVSLRVKLLSKTTTQVFVSKYDGVGQGEFAVYYEHAFRRFIFSTYSSGGTGNHYVLADALGEPQLDTWYELEATHDGLANTNTIVVNGTHKNILTGVGKHQDTSAPLRIGAFGTGPTYFAGAVIDDVRFYKAPVVDMPANLIGYWKFDEGSGSLAVDTAYGDHNGTVSGATYSADVPPDIEFDDPYSLDFDGVNDGVSTSLSLNNYSAFTLAGWAYPRTASLGEGWFGANDVFEFFFTGGDSVKCWTPQGEVDWSFVPQTFLNRWHHITCLGTGSAIILYVDGQQVASTSHAASGNYGTGSNFSIGLGVQNGGTSGPFDGRIDDVRVYNRALTPQEMSSLGTGSEQPVNNPTASSFSPADNATGVSLSPTLAATFSAASIATSTGNISVYKTNGNVLVESISVASSQVQKSGATISILPAVTLEESTEYYVSIPGTAFRDGDGLFYSGTAASTTWSFTTGDFSVPSISAVAASSSATSSIISWSTNEPASSRVVFGPTSSYGSTTPESNTSSRVTSHGVSVGPLASCVQYHYAVVSRDASGNAATSSASTFMTGGCETDAVPSSVVSSAVTSSSGGSTDISEGGKTFAVRLPPNATATSSSVVIQVKAVASGDVLATIGRPATASNEVGVTVFDVKAVIDGSTVLDSFDAAVTIEYEYSDGEVSGLSESSLWLYHYTGGRWEALDDCVLDTAANTISCTTPSFSIFGLFGNAASSAAQASSVGRVAGGTHFGCKDQRALNYEPFSHHKQELCTYASQGQGIQVVSFLRDLKIGMSGSDIQSLQKFLNSKGFAVAVSGPGASGNETQYFGPATRNALARFQKANGISPAVGFFGPITRAWANSARVPGL